MRASLFYLSASTGAGDGTLIQQMFMHRGRLTAHRLGRLRDLFGVGAKARAPELQVVVVVRVDATGQLLVYRWPRRDSMA